MKKRIIAIALAALMIFAFVGCGKSNKRKIIYLTLNTADSEAIMNAAGIHLPKPEEAAGANSVVKYLSWSDPFHNYSEDEIVHTGFYTFRERYNGDLEWIECDFQEKFNDLSRYYLTNNAPDMFPAGTSATATYPMRCMKGVFQSIDDYIDYSDPLWAGVSEIAESFSFDNKHYTIVTDTTFKDICVYNKRTIEDFGFEEPATLYENDEWTWQRFFDYCMEFSDADENRFALDGQAFTNSLVQATGQNFVHRGDDGKYYSNLDSPEIERAEQMLYDLTKADCTYHEGGSYWANRNGHLGGGMKEGLCLFYICETWAFTDTVEEISAIWGDIENGEVMFAPLPRDDNGDGNYYLISQIIGYMLCTGASNPEGAALLASCDRFKTIDPTVVDIDKKQLKEIYLWTDEMLQMVDTCEKIANAHPRAIVTGDMNDNINSIVASLQYGPCRSANPSTWAQVKEQNSENLEYLLEEFNFEMDDFAANGALEDD